MRKLIGDKKFYKMILAIAIPIMVQNGITNFVGLLDNIMVGRIGTEQMSGVAIVNQLIFVFNLCIFGGVSGAGIFGAQFFGQGNHEGVRNTFRFKLLTCIVLLLGSIAIFTRFGTELISLYLHDSNDVGNIALALEYGEKYLRIMMIQFIPFIIVQVYAGTLRETGETVIPMAAGIASVIVNLTFNYTLIYGKFGAPELGVEGAAIATVIARTVEASIIVMWTHRHRERNHFIQGAFKNFHIPWNLSKKIIIKGSPLLVNETLWAAGMAMLTQCYSLRGLPVVAGLNISSTITNLFNIVFIALGSALSIVVGQLLGAGKLKEAKETAGKMIFFSVTCCIIVGIIMALFAPLFTQIYNTTNEVKHLAKWFILITAMVMPLQAFMHATYFTMRSGGKTFITFLFDSVYVCLVSLPIAYILTRRTDLYILVIYFICQFSDIIKCIIGYILVKKGVWLQNIVEHNAEELD
ncbi:MAG TPA: MATE family efflux transporter [Lachnospiraceae bacterium]|nr:MATE family efflux transporter [Lachnospiraceae bacterium]